jgi:hypothetical protein
MVGILEMKIIDNLEATKNDLAEVRIAINKFEDSLTKKLDQLEELLKEMYRAV